MGLVSKIVIAVFLLVILLLPIISGAANVPKSLDPEAIGRFIASWIKYWLSIFRAIVSELMLSPLEKAINFVVFVK